MSTLRIGDRITNSNQLLSLPLNTEVKDHEDNALYYMSGSENNKYLTAYLAEGLRYPVQLKDVPTNMTYHNPLTISHLP